MWKKSWNLQSQVKQDFHLFLFFLKIQFWKFEEFAQILRQMWIFQSLTRVSLAIFVWPLRYLTNLIFTTITFTTAFPCNFQGNPPIRFLFKTRIPLLLFRLLHTANRKWPWLIKIRFLNLRLDSFCYWGWKNIENDIHGWNTAKSGPFYRPEGLP